MQKIKEITLQPDEEWVPSKDAGLVLPVGYNPVVKKENKCTCGMEKIGGGLHSDYCDLEAK